jgi:hypothetical protein
LLGWLFRRKSRARLFEGIETLKIAKEAGIFVIDVEGDQIDIRFSGGGSPENKDDLRTIFLAAPRRGKRRIE